MSRRMFIPSTPKADALRAAIPHFRLTPDPSSSAAVLPDAAPTPAGDPPCPAGWSPDLAHSTAPDQTVDVRPGVGGARKIRTLNHAHVSGYSS